LFQHNGEIYCVPETSAAREISLYRAENFPRDWKKVGTLIPDIQGIDPTVFQYNGLWWLMCTDRAQVAALNLLVWYAPDLTGPWQPHAQNPVKTDVRSSRPAGTPFIYQGCLYRPAQDCSQTYGGRITINRINQLTPTTFAEEPVKIVAHPTRGLFSRGFHTLSSAGPDATLVDGKRWQFTLTRIPLLISRLENRDLASR
jgi:hypothetical protein